MTYLKDLRIRVIAVICLAMLVILLYQIANAGVEETDNAIVRCDITDVVSEVSGLITNLNFTDNQFVPKDAVLVLIDDRSFRATNKKTQAEILVARSNILASDASKSLAELEAQYKVMRAKAQLDAASAKLRAVELERKAAEASLEVAQTREESEVKNEERVRTLFDKKFLGKKSFEDAERDLKLSRVNREAAQARLGAFVARISLEKAAYVAAQTDYKEALASLNGRIRTAKANFEISEIQVTRAEAENDLASIMLSRTEIRSRRSGHITNRRVALGNYVEIGQPIASITSCNEKIWIEANFKETQLEHMRPNQQVTVKVDAYPDRKFDGFIESVATGSGSMFSVLPPENATGNFTKVVQRFPVVIGLKGDVASDLRVGMSAVVSVKTR